MPVITNIDDLKRIHRRRVPKMFYDYCEGLTCNFPASAERPGAKTGLQVDRFCLTMDVHRIRQVPAREAAGILQGRQPRSVERSRGML